MTMEGWSPKDANKFVNDFLVENQLVDFEIVELPNLRYVSPDELKEWLSRLGAKLAFIERLLSEVDGNKTLYTESYQMASMGYTAFVQVHAPLKSRVSKDSISADAYLQSDVVRQYKNESVKWNVLFIRLEHLRYSLLHAYNAVSRVVALTTSEQERLRSFE